MDELDQAKCALCNDDGWYVLPSLVGERVFLRKVVCPHGCPLLSPEPDIELTAMVQ